jgi:flagellar secretion chaperone FliS
MKPRSLPTTKAAAPQVPASDPTGITVGPDPFSAAARARFSTGTHETVSQNRLVVMCFERLERDLTTARDAIGSGDLFGAHTNLVHAQDIIAVMRDALDTELWEQGAQLLALYDWATTELIRANTTKDVTPINAVAAALAPIGVAFEQASRAVRASNTPQDDPFSGAESREGGISVRA